MTREPPRIIQLDQIEPVPGPGSLTWRPVRRSLGRREAALDALRRALELRPQLAELAPGDEDFAGLYDDPGFRSLLEHSAGE